MSTTSANTHISQDKSFFKKIKKHKTQIIVTSTVICTTIVGFLIYKKMAPKELVKIKGNVSRTLSTNRELRSLESNLPTTANIIELPLGKTTDIPGHPRTLPLGYKASEKQLEIARSLGVTLTENQTYVTDYSRKIA